MVARHEPKWRHQRYTQHLRHDPQRASPLPAHQVREPEHHEPADRTQQRQAPPPVAPAQRVQDDIDALTVGQPEDLAGVIDPPVIDRVGATFGP
jgi:hypothetical protein